LRIQEIEEAASRFRTCPKCKSAQGFWLGLKRDHLYVQCKECGALFELFKVYSMEKKSSFPQNLAIANK